jgi:hypothetical protein
MRCEFFQSWRNVRHEAPDDAAVSVSIVQLAPRVEAARRDDHRADDRALAVGEEHLR